MTTMTYGEFFQYSNVSLILSIVSMLLNYWDYMRTKDFAPKVNLKSRHVIQFLICAKDSQMT